jgi:EAL domain-containing protein (putative c-di-GMP-specific phosphodiesterase class I)
VNLSSVQFKRGDLEKTVMLALSASGLDPKCLGLELTESILIHDSEYALALLHRLKELGVKLSIDDFGTGYSSLSSLQRFPVDTLQLDHSFVANLGRNKEATTIAQAVIGLAHGLGLKVVAEGVERPDQIEHLRALGCEQAQGNYFSEPLDGAQLAAYLASQDTVQPPKAVAKSGSLSA